MKLCTALVTVLLCSILINAASADTLSTSQDVYLSYSAGESLAIQDTTNNVTITVTVQAGALTGFGNLTLTLTGGTLKVAANSTGTLAVTSSRNGTYFYINDASYSGPFVVSGDLDVVWQFEEDNTQSTGYALVVALIVSVVVAILLIVFRRSRSE